MKLLLSMILCLGLFVIHAFRSKDVASSGNSTAISRRNVISCGPSNSRLSANFTNFGFTPGGELMEKISINENRTPAGELRDGVLFLNLEAREGNWFPETEEGKPL